MAAKASKVVKSADRPKPPNAGKGRKRGVPNKVTGDLRKMVVGALAKAGGEKYLLQQAQENPTAFLTLVGKCLPKEVTGPNGSYLFPTKITIECVSAHG